MTKKYRPKTCAGCGRQLTYVIHPCRRCKKNYCSPAVRDCVLVHGCTEPLGAPIKVERPEPK